MEEWKDIPRFEGLYQASNTGKIRSVDRVKYQKSRSSKWTYKKYKGTELKYYIDRYGYKTVTLYKNNIKKTYTVHKLIAVTWITDWDNYKSIDHIDCNKLNNNIKNLDNVPMEENLRREWEETKHLRKRDSLGRFIKKGVV